MTKAEKYLFEQVRERERQRKKNESLRNGEMNQKEEKKREMMRSKVYMV